MSLVPARYYSSGALATTLAAPLATTGNPSVNSISGLPSSYPFTVLIDWGLATQEAISVTSAPTGTGPWSLPCVRGIDGSTGGSGGAAHNSGALVVHGVTAQDFAQPATYLAGLGGFPWQFNVQAYGAKGDGQAITDGAITSGQAAVSTVGLSAPVAPTVNNSGTLGTIGAGVYQVKVTYVNPAGETVASSATSTTTSGSTSTITITTPVSSGNATGWYAYVTQVGGSSFTRQQTVGQPTPIGINLVLTSAPSNTGVDASTLSNTTASAPWSASADPGKTAVVYKAGSAAAHPLVTTISSATSNTLTLAGNAGTTVSSGGWVFWGTDDTGAFQAAVNAAVSCAQSNGGYAEVIVPPVAGFYMIAGNKITNQGGNAQIYLPYIGNGSATITIRIRGASVPAPPLWTSTAPWLSGSTLFSTGVYASAGTQTSDTASFGNGCVIGGPSPQQGYGVNEASLSIASYSNMICSVEDLQITHALDTQALTYSAFDFSGLKQARAQRFACGANTTYGQTWSSGGNITSLATGSSVAFLLPVPGNNVENDLSLILVNGGYNCGPFLTEHTVVPDRLTTLYLNTAGAIVGSYGGSSGALHAVKIAQWCNEGCTNQLRVVGVGSSGFTYVDIDQLDVEMATTLNFTDTTSGTSLTALRGNIGVTGKIPTGININGSALTTASQLGARVIYRSQLPGIVSSPPAVAGSGTGVVNNTGRDCTVTVAANGATGIAVALDGTTITGVTTGVPVSVPVWHVITLTYSGGPPTWQWNAAGN